ncbi:energy transducer TonB [Christiangramia sp. SM2212]|uniref:Energy transducer TonB n=1 Tax=Christiangramia sediminicola TaxID=3073267 RepID=A0ABU1ELW8_9FLAO|nr:energy transducer TonB [Christiangramia sp. SM2212]MDR5589375.1 energy transducer TonB [Christiangramia sp. SM2212]
MKKLLLLVFLAIPFTQTFAQNLSIQNVDTAPKLKAECLKDDSTECFEKSIMNYIRTNLDITKLVNNEGGTAYAQFVVTEEGKITDIRTRSTSKPLEKEAKRLIKKLKIKEPAVKNGENVSIIYTVPVTFQKRQFNNYDEFLDSETAGKEFIELTDVYKAPSLSGCESNKNCLKETIQDIVLNKLKDEKFSSGEIKLLNLSFVINKDSEITNIMAMVPNAEMQRVTKSVLEAIKIESPGLDEKGNAVDVLLKYKFNNI